MFPHIDQDIENLGLIVSGIGTLAGIAYTAFQNARAKKQLEQVHKETISKLTETKGE